MKMGIFKNFGETGRYVATKMRHMRPDVALGLGVLGLIGGTIWACTKTKQAVNIIEETKTELEDKKNEYDQMVESLEESDKEGLKAVKKDYFWDRTRIYGSAGWKFTKLYAGPMLVWGSGLYSVTYGHFDLKKQNKKLLLDTLATTKLFEEYRARVRQEIGEEREKEVYFGTSDEEMDVQEVDPETGNMVKKRKKGRVIPQNTGSQFARNFNEQTSNAWDARSYAQFYVEGKFKEFQQRWASGEVRFLTVNDFYDLIHMKPEYGRCEAGMDWGWPFNPFDPENDRNKPQITWLQGWEYVKNDYSGEFEWLPSERFDLNAQPLRGRI